MKPTAFIGIDPGASGAIALLSPEWNQVEQWPGDPGAAADLLRSWRVQFDIRLAALERVSARPGQGVSSTFSFGVNFGTWQGILAALGIPYVMPPPGTWQKFLIVPSDGPDPKARALASARRRFPDADLRRKCDHGKADALLLAVFASKEHRR